MESPVDIYEDFVNDSICYVVKEDGEIDLTVKLSYANLYRAFKRWLKLTHPKTKRLNSKACFPEFIRVLGRQRSHRWQGIVLVGSSGEKPEP